MSDALGPESPAWLTAATIVWLIVIFGLSNGFQQLVDLLSIDINTDLIAAQVISIVADVLLVVMFTYYQNAKRDFLMNLITLYGFGKMMVNAVKDYLDPPDTEQTIASLVLPIPSQYAYLKKAEYRDDPDVAPFAILVNCIADIIGYVTGGMLLTNDASTAAAARSLGGRRGMVWSRPWPTSSPMVEKR